MSTVEKMLKQVLALGGVIIINGERVTVRAPQGAITPEFRAVLSSHKQEIRQHLEAAHDGETYIPRDLNPTQREQELLRGFQRVFGAKAEIVSREEADRLRQRTIPARNDDSLDYSPIPTWWKCKFCRAKGKGSRLAVILEEHAHRSPQCFKLNLTVGDWVTLRKKKPVEEHPLVEESNDDD